MRTIDPELQAQVNAQLLEHGAFAPLELLFDSGRLAYGDYERWLRGEVESLDAALMGNPGKISAELEDACTFATSIGLVREVRHFHPSSASGDAHQDARRLRISSDSHLTQLIASRYRPAQKAPQMDLFVNNPVVVLTNDLANALCARDLPEAQRHLERLYSEVPSHPDLAAYDRLVHALGHLNRRIEETRSELGLLMEAVPISERLLGARARELTTPLWQQLADALGGQPFSPSEPALHRSFALDHARNWVALAECVLGEPGWWMHAPLCLHLARSGFYRQHRVHNLGGWFQLCWHSPDHAAEALDRLDQPDQAMTARWERFTDSESSGALTPQDFPAWMLLTEPELAQVLPADLPTTNTAGESHYRCAHRWIHARRTGRREEEMAQRKALMLSHPVLFHWLKRSV